MGDERRRAQVGGGSARTGALRVAVGLPRHPPKISRSARDVTSEILWGITMWPRSREKPRLRRSFALPAPGVSRLPILQLLNS
jgi:hypothetical protein